MGSFGIGITEVLLILVLALLVFGPGKVPDIARGLGKALRQFNKYSSGLTSQFKEEFEKELGTAPAAQRDSPVARNETASENRSAPTEPEPTKTQSADEQ